MSIGLTLGVLLRNYLLRPEVVAPGGDGITMENADAITMENGDPIVTG